jgi:hypothetical protein
MLIKSLWPPTIIELLENAKTVPCKHKPYILNPLIVIENKTKQRLVLGLQKVNPCLVKHSMKFECFTFVFSTLFQSVTTKTNGLYLFGYIKCKYIYFQHNIEKMNVLYACATVPATLGGQMDDQVQSDSNNDPEIYAVDFGGIGYG